jgi:hypothetical protein
MKKHDYSKPSLETWCNRIFKPKTHCSQTVFLLDFKYKINPINMTDKKLFELCKKYGENARTWQRKFVALLPEVFKRRLYKKHGCYSIHEFAAKLGGVSHKTVDEVLRLHERTKNVPQLQNQIEKHGWAKVRTVTSLIGTVKEKDLVEMIENLPKKSLEKGVQELKVQKGLAVASENIALPGEKLDTMIKMSFNLDPETKFRLRKLQQKLEKERKQTVSFNEVIKTMLDAVEEKPKKKPKTRKTKSRTVSAAQQYELDQTYHGKCGFPGCNEPSINNHHPERYALKKNHEKLVPLCKCHHDLAHAGLIANEELPPQYWKIRNHKDITDFKFAVDQRVLEFKEH